MASRRRTTGEMSMSLRFIVDREQRIAKQRQLIAEMKKSRRPTGRAEAVLKRHQEALTTLRNHADIIQDLMRPDPHGHEHQKTR